MEEDMVDFPDELDTSFFARVRQKKKKKKTRQEQMLLHNRVSS